MTPEKLKHKIEIDVNDEGTVIITDIHCPYEEKLKAILGLIPQWNDYIETISDTERFGSTHSTNDVIAVVVMCRDAVKKVLGDLVEADP